MLTPMPTATQASAAVDVPNPEVGSDLATQCGRVSAMEAFTGADYGSTGLRDEPTGGASTATGTEQRNQT